MRVGVRIERVDSFSTKRVIDDHALQKRGFSGAGSPEDASMPVP